MVLLPRALRRPCHFEVGQDVGRFVVVLVFGRTPSSIGNAVWGSRGGWTTARSPQRLVRQPGDDPAAASAGGRWSRGESLFDGELRRCPDSLAVLRVGCSTRMQLGLVDLCAFFDRLKALGNMPKAGADLHKFVAKVREALLPCEAGGMQIALTNFAELRCRVGTLDTWSLIMPHLGELPTAALADSVWAITAVRKPPVQVIREVTGLVSGLRRLQGLPATSLYRCVYGLTRITRGAGCAAFRQRAELALMEILRREGPPAYTPQQLVRLCWAFARLGSRESLFFRALELHLQQVVQELSDKELEALYRVLTDLQLMGQWRLIHTLERAMEARQPSQLAGPGIVVEKAPRRHGFTRKWTRPDILFSVLPRRTGPRRRR